MAVLGLHCYMWASSSFSLWGLLIAVASLIADCGLYCTGFSSWWCMGLVVPRHEGILDSRPKIELMPLYWQADSYPLDHQEVPGLSVLNSASLLCFVKCLFSSSVSLVVSFHIYFIWKGTFNQLVRTEGENRYQEAFEKNKQELQIVVMSWVCFQLFYSIKDRIFFKIIWKRYGSSSRRMSSAHQQSHPGVQRILHS